MTNLLLTSILFGMCLSPVTDREIHEGYFSRYNLSPTAATIAYRQHVGDLPVNMSHYDGVIAVADCSMVGKDAWVYVDGIWYDMIVFDCSGHEETSLWMEQNRILGEWGYYFAERLNLLEAGGVPGMLSYDPPVHNLCGVN